MAEEQFVIFTLADEEFCVETVYIQEIIKMVEYVSLPNLPEFIKGVANLRGRIVPIIDLRRKLNLSSQQDTHTNRIIVLAVKNVTFGIIVDSVSEVIRIASSSIEDNPSFTSNVAPEYLKGLAKIDDRILILLDIFTVFSLSDFLFEEETA